MSDNAMIVPYKNSGYGAIELKLIAKIAMIKAMLISSAMAFGSVGGFYGVGFLFEGDEFLNNKPPVIICDFGVIPSETQALPSVGVASRTAIADKGIPVPVPDAEVNPEQTIATQKELSEEGGSEMEGGTRGGYSIPPDDVPPRDFEVYEKEPFIVKSVKPVYPDLALRVGLEGTVVVKMWVDREGKVRQAVITRSDSPIFEQVSIDAAMQHVFTPALMQQRPVAVWVSIPFKFRLASSK